MDNETHRRIASEPVGIVDIFVSGQAPEHSLTKLRDQPVTTVPAGSHVGKNVAGYLRQPKNVVEFPKSRQTGIRRDQRIMKFQLQLPVEIEPKTSQLASPVAGAMIGASIFE